METELPKNLNNISHFFVLSEIYVKFGTFSKKDEPHSSCISEIRDCKKCGYLNVLKASFRNIFWRSTY